MGSDATQPQKRCRIKIGTYTGNGADNRNINIGIDLTKKTNVFIHIKSQDNTSEIFRSEHGQGDSAQTYTGAAAANWIQALTSTGFQIGSDSHINYSSYVYHYRVFWEEI